MKKLVLVCLMLAACKGGKSQEQPNQDTPELIGGRPADPKDWPASVYAAMDGARCSATLVGSETLIIASHCVAHGAQASFSIGANSYTSVCSRSPLYRKGIDHDLALCKVTRPVEGVAFENVNQDSELVKVGSEILLTGYGCIRQGGGGGNDGIYRIGEAKVNDLPGGRSYDYVVSGKAALCFGDSGGPAFKINGTERTLISVNSKGDIRTTSYLTSTSTQASKDFIASWSDANKVRICGIHSDAQGCRGEKPTPPQPTPPAPPKENCKTLYEKLGACIKSDTIFFE